MISAKDKLTHSFYNVFRFLVSAVLLMLCLIDSSHISAQSIPTRPNPPRLVNDFAHLMSADEVNTLENKLDRYDDSTTTQIAIVTIETLDGADIGSYAADLGEKWGVGSKKNLNGVVILVSKKEHKISIRTGYGVEEKLGAIITDRIRENQLTPNFRNGNYYAGFNAATDEMIQRLSGTFKGNGQGAQDKKTIPLWAIVLIVVFLLFILPLFFKGGGGNDTFGGGGILGAGLGGFIGGGGFGGGGGGDSGGGFGGFGGGGFSGGGSSGSW